MIFLFVFYVYASFLREGNEHEYYGMVDYR